METLSSDGERKFGLEFERFSIQIRSISDNKLEYSNGERPCRHTTINARPAGKRLNNSIP
ncbi:hypothetical protein LEP1GSC137_3583 [Leptospira borgpetersenii str. Noumea 25]|nr:hypothetical protein LEP1GSC137_3583 [Leptospira borgpetersenii str. Noumea 25]